VALPGVGIGLADALYESGFYSAEEISQANIEDLVQIRGIGEEKAAKLLEAAESAAVDAAKKNEVAEDDTPAEATKTDTINEEDALPPSEPSEEVGPAPSDDGELKSPEEVGSEPSGEGESEPPEEVGPEPSGEGESEPPEENGSEDKND